MSAVAVIPSLLPVLVVVAMRRAEERIHGQLVEAKALTAESAVPLSPRSLLGKGRLQGLVRGGAVRVTANDHYFLDADGWDRYQRNRRRRGLFAVTVVVALLGLAAALLLLLQ